MPIKNYTTKLGIDPIVGRITGLLASKGARQVSLHYDRQGSPDGIGFLLVLDSVPVPFQLPCNWEGVQRAIAKEDRKHRAPRTPEHAKTVAWAIVRDWVEAQLALIEAEQATMAQVFLPYCVLAEDHGQGQAVTMYDKFMDQISKQKRLPGAK